MDGCIVQVVDYLSSKHKVLSSNPIPFPNPNPPKAFNIATIKEFSLTFLNVLRT
jgi:hypothetical protein